MHAVLFSTFLGLAATGLAAAIQREHLGARAWPSGVGGFGAILFFHKFCALVLTHRISDSCEGDLHAWSCSSREGNLLGIDLDGGQLEGREGPVRPPALVCGTGSEAAV